MNMIIGQKFKNYKELCDYLKEPVKTGKSKQLQILNWGRYFEYEKDGHKFIITDVYETPKEKTQRTGNNIKNLRVMIDYLQCLGFLIVGYEWTSMTDWYCEKLELLNKNICNLFYGEKSEIEWFCGQKKITDIKLFHKYVTYTKSELKDLFVKSLRYLEKKNLVEYVDGYRFIYQMGRRSKGHAGTEMVNETIKEYETFVCNEMNKRYALTDKLTGRQILFLIYGKKELYTEFQKSVITMLMENEDVLDILNESASDQNEGYIECRNEVCSERPLLSYHKAISIISINEQEGDCDIFKVKLCNLLRKKVRSRLWNEHFTSKHTNRTIYPYDDTEKVLDIIRIERQLFQAYDFEFDDDSYCDVLKYELCDELSDCSAEMADNNFEEILFDGGKWAEDEGLPF